VAGSYNMEKGLAGSQEMRRMAWRATFATAVLLHVGEGLPAHLVTTLSRGRGKVAPAAVAVVHYSQGHPIRSHFSKLVSGRLVLPVSSKIEGLLTQGSRRGRTVSSRSVGFFSK
jgi:hypothetical protein